MEDEKTSFLKLLKGSAMRNEHTDYDIKYRDKAPYEIISNKYITSQLNLLFYTTIKNEVF